MSCDPVAVAGEFSELPVYPLAASDVVYDGTDRQVKTYLAGPMRGYPLDNFPEFTAAAARIREMGHEVFSPAEHDLKMGYDPVSPPEWFDIREALRADLEWICLNADAVVVLPGWHHSRGAMAETHTARALDLPVYELEDFLMGGMHEVEL